MKENREKQMVELLDQEIVDTEQKIVDIEFKLRGLHQIQEVVNAVFNAHWMTPETSTTPKPKTFTGLMPPTKPSASRNKGKTYSGSLSTKILRLFSKDVPTLTFADVGKKLGRKHKMTSLRSACHRLVEQKKLKTRKHDGMIVYSRRS